MVLPRLATCVIVVSLFLPSTGSLAQEDLETQKGPASPPGEPRPDLPVPAGRNDAPPAVVRRVFRQGEGGLVRVQNTRYRLPGDSVAADEKVTVIYRLDHIAPGAAIQTIYSLLQPSGPSRVAGMASWRLTEVERSSRLIVSGPASMVEYLLDLLVALDVPETDSTGPGRVVEIIQLEHIDANEFLGIAQSFLQGRSRPRIAMSTRPAPVRPAGGSVRAPETRLFADPRTQKLIVETYSTEDLEDLRMLVGELDIGVGPRSPVRPAPAPRPRRLRAIPGRVQPPVEKPRDRIR